jgi:AbrB family looped-hinge helix DNA binding protein
MQTHALKVSREGRILIPAEVRAALRLVEGSLLTLRVEDNEIRLCDRTQALRRAQDIAAKYKKVDESVVDDFLDERRIAAQSE